jgi:hypothetical protein
MNILQYDLDKHSFEEVWEVTKYLQSHNFEVLAIPKDFDLLLDVDTYTLNLIKEKIEEAIRQKEIINNM